MRRLLILVLIGSLTAAGCGRFSTGEAAPDEPVAVGEGVDLAELGDEKAAADAPPAEAGEAANTPAPPAGVGEPAEESYHPRTPSGEVMWNVTVREVDGLVLQLSVEELSGQPGDLLFDLLVDNERDTALFFDPTYPDAIVITDGSGNRVWSAGECELRADSDYGHPTLEPGDDTLLAFRYAASGDGNPACVIPAGDYEAVASFAWCHPERHEGGECRQLTTSQSYPLRIKFADA